MNFKLKSNKKFKSSDYEYYVIGADIGGTNTRIGFAGVKRKRFDFLFSLTYPSDEFHSLSLVLKHAKKTAKEGFGVKVKKVCLGVAGPITRQGNYCVMTNANWNVDRRKLRRQTGMNILPLVNDLEAMGHSVDYLNKKDLFKLVRRKPQPKGRKVVIAAGTGLGKCMIHEHEGSKLIIPSEVGNDDFSATTTEDIKLMKFIKERKRIRAPIQFEDVVSGPGIENIYYFLSQKKKSAFKKEIEKSSKKSEEIMRYKNRDSVCRETAKIFAKHYGRFIKNVAFDDLPTAGIYLAGSISSRNLDIFTKSFLKEFYNSETHQKLLKSIPIFVILDDDAGLIGACSVAAKI